MLIGSYEGPHFENENILHNSYIDNIIYIAISLGFVFFDLNQSIIQKVSCGLI